MALLIEQTLYNGDIVRYHYFAKFKINGNICSAEMHSYRDKQHRGLPVQPVIKREYDFLVNPSGNIRGQAYEYVKTLPEFVDSEDV